MAYRTWMFLAIFLTATIMAAMPVHAQELKLGDDYTGANKERTEEFFADCVERPIFQLSEETNYEFCACSASAMQVWLDKPVSKTDKEFYEANQKKELSADNLISEVYGPCLYIPIYEMSNEDCLNSKRHNFYSRGPQYLDILCHCMAEGDEGFFRQMAQPYLQLKISEGKKIVDPIEFIKRSDSYYNFSYDHQTLCYDENKALP